MFRNKRKLFRNYLLTYLVPCRLNEGFTVFLERKILGRRKGEKMVDFAYIGKTELKVNFVN